MVKSSSMNRQVTVGLRQLIAAGIPNGQRDDLRGETEYENANFALMRVMIPYIWGDIPDSVLNGDSPLSDLPSDVRTYVEGDWSGSITQDRLLASVYKYYTINNVFVPMGINGAATEGFGPNQTRTYPFPAGNDSGNPTGDRTLLSGGEGWFLDARELRTFLDHVRREDTVLDASTRQMMQTDRLGFSPGSTSTGRFGTYLAQWG